MATKVFFYTLRPYDELGIAQRLAPQLDVEFGSTQEYPTLENAELAKGYDAVSVTPCDMSAPMVKRFHELGVKSICCRSIGYDHALLRSSSTAVTSSWRAVSASSSVFASSSDSSFSPKPLGLFSNFVRHAAALGDQV